MSNIKESESMLVVSFSFIYFMFCPIASLAVHVGLWNGVDRMVGLCFSSSFVFLAPVTKLIGVVSTEVSVAPNVELMERQETDFIDHDETNNHKMLLCSPIALNGGGSSALHVKWSREKREGDGKSSLPHRKRERSLLLQPGVKATVSSSSSSPF